MTLHGGRIVYRIDYGNDIRLEINTTEKYNTGQWISIEVAREFTSKQSTENGSLKVNNEEPSTGSPTTPITSSLLPDFSRSSFYLGGVSPGYQHVNSKAPDTESPFLGCMKDIQINGEMDLIHWKHRIDMVSKKLAKKSLQSMTHFYAFI